MGWDASWDRLLSWLAVYQISPTMCRVTHMEYKLIMLIIMVEMAATFVMSKLVYAPEAKASLLNSSWCWLPRRMAQRWEFI